MIQLERWHILVEFEDESVRFEFEDINSFKKHLDIHLINGKLMPDVTYWKTITTKKQTKDGKTI